MLLEQFRVNICAVFVPFQH